MNNPQYQQNPGYGNPYASQQAPNFGRPATQLKSDRNWIAYILLNYVTCQRTQQFGQFEQYLHWFASGDCLFKYIYLRRSR